MDSGRLRARVTLTRGGRSLDYELEFRPSATVRDLMTQWDFEEGRPPAVASAGSGGVIIEASSAGGRFRPERRLGLDDLLSSVTLLHGDRLTWCDKPQRRWIENRLGLIIGPDTPDQRHVELTEGSWRIGRDAVVNDVVIDDPSVSRHHATITVAAAAPGRHSAPVGAPWLLCDRGSRNGTLCDGVEAEGLVPLRIGSEIDVGHVRMVVVQPGVSTSGDIVIGSLGFNRPPRPASEVPVVELEAPDLPPRMTRIRLPWISALIPALMAVVVVTMSLSQSAGAPAAGRGVGGVSGGYLVVSAMFLFMSPLMVIASYVESRRGARSSAREFDLEFDASMARLGGAGDAALDDECRMRRAAHPSPAEWLDRVRRGDDQLWCWTGSPCRPTIRVGTGHVSSLVRVVESTLRNSSATRHQRAVEAVAGRLAIASHVPVTIDLDQCTIIGLVGTDAECADVARAMALQLASGLAPHRLRFRLVVPVHSDVEWAALRWLPHRVELAAEPAESAGPADTGDGQRDGQMEVVIVHGGSIGGRARWSSLLARRDDERPVVIWMSNAVSDLPAECGRVVDCATGGGTLSGVAVELDRVTATMADAWCRALAPWRDIGSDAMSATPPPAVALLAQALGTSDTILDNPAGVFDRWERSRGRSAVSSLAAPIGVGRGGHAVELDLRADGPHGIVAGTTGAGKSELLQAFIVSLAATHPPDRVNFLLIDYKGGAAFGDCVRLPHAVGLVTDLDAGLVDRVLRSLAAEIKHRERILHRAGAPSLVEMELVGHPDSPPSLVIVVDEFASLVAEVPDFVEQMVDIARRGRSLGIHLLLATQRPAGVIGDNVRANSSLRIALRVADDPESSDVVGSSEAARIDRTHPGRAYARLGDGALVEFQTAFGGRRSAAPVAGARQDTALVLMCFPRWPGAEPELAHESDNEGAAGLTSRFTDLERLVTTIARAGRAAGIAPPRRPWLDALPEVIHPDDLARAVGPNGDPGTGRALAGAALVGVIDDPDHQRRRPFVIDLDACGSAVVYGAGRHGTASVLEAIAVASSRGYSPEVVQIDVVGSRAGQLGRLRDLPQVGSLIDLDDRERVERLLRQLWASIGGAQPRARRILIVEDCAAFVATSDEFDGGAMTELLARIVAEGRSAMVHVVFGADRRSAVPRAIASAVGARLVMPMATREEADGLGADLSVVGEDPPPGRGVVDGYLTQVALWPGGSEMTDAAWATMARSEVERFGSCRAPEIGFLPTVVSLSYADRVPSPGSIGSVVLGMADDDLCPVTVDLFEGHLLVAGPLRSGRTTALARIAGSPAFAGGWRCFLVTPRRSTLDAAVQWSGLAHGDQSRDLLEALGSDFDRTGATRIWQPTVLMVDDATDLSDEVAQLLAGLARRGRDHGLVLVVAGESSRARSDFGGVFAELRRDRRALLLQPDVELDGDLGGIRLKRRGHLRAPATGVVPGRGELVIRGEARLVQVAVGEQPGWRMGDRPHVGASPVFLP